MVRIMEGPKDEKTYCFKFDSYVYNLTIQRNIYDAGPIYCLNVFL